MRTLLVFSVLILLFAPGAPAQPCRDIIGYYPAWQAADRGGLVMPATLHYAKYSIINYAFLQPAPDGSIRLIQPRTDKRLLLGPFDPAVSRPAYEEADDPGDPQFHLPGQKFSDYARAGGCKFMLSIGGWTHSGLFSQIAADPVKRARFAGDCSRLTALYGADGVDIDWEYPGYAPHNGGPDDRRNFTLLLRQIRDSLDLLEPRLRRELLLTSCFGAAPVQLAAIDWPEVVPLLDRVNLMTYDYHGLWDTTTNHNSPLFAIGPHAPPGGSAAESAQILLQLYAVPAEKITLGIPFYGKTQRTIGEPDLFVPGTGLPDTITLGPDGTAYYNLEARRENFEEHWDADAQVPFRTAKNGVSSFLSFENQRSAGLKAAYVREHDLRGLIIWEITQDYVEPATGAPATPLLDTIRAVFCAPAPISSRQLSMQLDYRPQEGKLVLFLDPAASGGELLIFEETGQEIYREGPLPASKRRIDREIWVRDWKPGRYAVALRAPGGGLRLRRLSI